MIQYKLQPYSIMELGQRANQEDSMFPALGQSTGQDRLFVLCDGMGGHAKGEVASAAICEAMSSYILARWTPDQPLDDFLFNEALNAAFDALDARDTDDPKKMGSTMTFLCFHAHGVTVAHIGDSRVYQLRPATGDSPARVVFKTRDHSLVNDLVAVGEITEEEARNHPQKNVITRAMQPHQPYRVKADIKHITDVKVGDYFYMCSDGMLEQTSDDNLLFIIFKDDTSNEDKVEMLREVTRDNRDNHTAHLIQVTGVEGTIPARVQQVTSTMTAQPSQQNGTPMNAYGGRPQQTAGNYHSTSAPSVVSGVAHKDKGASKQRIIVIALLAIVAALLLVIALKMFVFGDDKKDEYRHLCSSRNGGIRAA